SPRGGGRRCCQCSSGRERSGPGSSTTPGFPRRARIRWAWHANIAASSASRYCQARLSLSVANAHASLPIAYRLYLPESWANDADRRAKAGIPEDVVFRTKAEIALDQIRAALAAGVPRGVVLADAGYGIDTALRTGLTQA